MLSTPRLVAAARTGAPSPLAIAEAQKALTADPDDAPALYLLGLAAERQSDFKAAGTWYDRLLRRYPAFAPASRNLALLSHEHLGQDAKAYALAVKAREAYPSDPRLAKLLGVLAYQQGDLARAVEWLEQGTRQLDRDAEAAYYLGMAHVRRKEMAAGREALQRALALNLAPPLALEAHRALGDAK